MESGIENLPEQPRHLWRAAALTTALLCGVGLWALDLQARQGRDTQRTLDLEDLETALHRRLAQTGTLPPTDASTWCGVVNAPENRVVRDTIETSLRETKKYARAEKPFPADPRFSDTARDYAYWKTSPVSFELLAELEADRNNSRPLNLASCELRLGNARSPATRGEGYDYALISAQRSFP